MADITVSEIMGVGFKGGTLSFKKPAAETIQKGDFVWVTQAGTVKKVSDTMMLNKQTIDYIYGKYMSVCQLTSNTFVITYTKANLSNGYVRVITLDENGEITTLGSEYSFTTYVQNNANTDTLRIVGINSTTIMLYWIGTSNYVYARAATISGTTPTFGTAATVLSSAVSAYPVIATKTSSNGSMTIFRYNPGTTGVYAQAHTISGNTITAGSTVLISSGTSMASSSAYNSLFSFDTGRFAYMCPTGNGLWTWLCSVSGTTITTTYAATAQPEILNSATWAISYATNKILACAGPNQNTASVVTYSVTPGGTGITMIYNAVHLCPSASFHCGSQIKIKDNEIINITRNWNEGGANDYNYFLKTNLYKINTRDQVEIGPQTKFGRDFTVTTAGDIYHYAFLYGDTTSIITIFAFANYAVNPNPVSCKNLYLSPNGTCGEDLIVGISNTDCTSTQTCEVVVSGLISNTTKTFVPGSLYTDTSGIIIAKALSPNHIMKV